jgi:hypothetical protein
MFPLKPERKAQLEEYAKRRGQDPAAALDDALATYPTWSGSARTSQKPLRASATATRMWEPGVPDPPPSFSPICARSMTFRVETTATAEQDADSVLDWLLSQYAGNAGMRWFPAGQYGVRPAYPARPSSTAQAVTCAGRAHPNFSARSQSGAWAGRGRSSRLRGERLSLDCPSAPLSPDRTSLSSRSTIPSSPSGRRT